MKKSLVFSISLIITAILLSITLSSKTFAQSTTEVGKLYTKANADQLYGKVIESVAIDSKLLKKIVDNAGKYVMFYFKNGKLKIFNEKRSEIYPNEGATVDSNEPLRLFSASKVNELLSSGKSDVTTVEIRQDVLTVTSGMTTLEFAILCPPNCIW